MAFYEPTADPHRFVATGHTAGLWSAASQHAGPPSALLIREIEATPSTVEGRVRLGRLTVEILGPVPVAEVSVRARVARPGRSVELVEAELSAGDRPVLLARAWRVRSVPLEGPGNAAAAPPMPDVRTVFADPAMHSGYLDAMEWRFVTGGFEEEGPAQVWIRQRMPLVDGEDPSAVQRLITAADSGNGVSRLYDFNRWWFINTELSVHLVREPAGEWIHLDATTTLGPDGLGLAQTAIYDAAGRVGSGAQCLMIGRRP